MSTEAQKRASTNYNRRQDNIMIRPNKEEGAAIRAAAAAAGMSVQAYVLRAVRVWMENEWAGSDSVGLPVGVVDTENEQKAPQTVAVVSHKQDEKIPPAKLSPDDWAGWAQRQDDEPLEDWMARLKKSNIGTSPADIMKRIGKLPKHDRDLILGTDPTAGGRRSTGRG